MQRLFDGVFLLEGAVADRPLQLIYLRGSSASLLMDTGCAHDPSRFIAPQIEQAGGDPARLTWILNTHSDLDHIGGNHEMKRLAPRAILACGDADRHACQGLGALMRYRYDVNRQDHQIYYEGDTLAWLEREGGEPQPIDATFVGGERIYLGDGWEVEVMSVPGHSKGHLAIWDERHQALYAGDAIHGNGYAGLDGQMKLCPTYEDVDQYLDTVARIERTPITTYVGCHWPVKRGGEIAQFCAESRRFVETADAALFGVLDRPLSMREICQTIGPSLGTWPRATDLELVYALSGHLARAAERGAVAVRYRQSQPPVLEYVRDPGPGCGTG
jgi:glyoxylase-like metal-dependent hydrolase (beta-lactamase superfamily II)